MANTIPSGGAGKTGAPAGGGMGSLSPQSQAQLAQFMQQLQAKTAQDNQMMIAQSQAQLDQMTGGVGKLGGPTGFENLANNMLGPVTGGGPNANPGATGLPGAAGLGPNPLDPNSLNAPLGTPGGPGAIPGLGGTTTAPLGGLGNNLGLGADPTGLGAGSLTNPMTGLMGGI